MGIPKKKEFDYAKILYTQERLSFADIAERTGVSAKTISKWCKDGGWDEIRKSLLITKQTQIVHLYNQLEWLNNDIAQRDVKVATIKEADTLIKITAAIKRLEVETSIGEIIEVGRAFLDFVKDVDFSKVKDITTLFDQFVQSKIR